MTKKYTGPIEVEFDSLPNLVPQTIDTQSSNAIARFNGARERRNFQLDKDWRISIGNSDESVNGDIVIPVTHNGKTTTTDGSSTPLPSLVKIASLGVLRPSGVMLTAALVHSFAYEHGGLLYKKTDGSTEFREISRDKADNLFRDIIATVNNLPFISKIAWLAARLSYFGTTYGGQEKAGETPSKEIGIAAGILLIVLGYFSLFGIGAGIVLLAVFYGLGVMILNAGNKEDAGAGDKPNEKPEAT